MAATELNSVNSLINDANLKAYYRFESGALTTDSSGEGHTLTAISDPAEDASGQFGGAVALDGNDAYSATDHADFKPTGNFTIGAWINTASTAAEFLISWSANTNIAGIKLGLDGSGKARLVSGRNTGTVQGTDYQVIISTSTINNSAWRFVVGTWDGSNLRLYVDGSSAATAVAWANAPGYAATNFIRVGCSNNGLGDITFLTGSLDDVFIFNGTALSADQIASIYDGTINSTSPSISPSISVSRSPSASPSVSLSSSPSISPSLSPSTSKSISPSSSPSLSPSISPSQSFSQSISVSISPSISPSPSRMTLKPRARISDIKPKVNIKSSYVPRVKLKKY